MLMDLLEHDIKKMFSKDNLKILEEVNCTGFE